MSPNFLITYDPRLSEWPVSGDSAQEDTSPQYREFRIVLWSPTKNLPPIETTFTVPERNLGISLGNIKRITPNNIYNVL